MKVCESSIFFCKHYPFFRIENHKIVRNVLCTESDLLILGYKNSVGKHHVYLWTKHLFNHDPSSSCVLSIAKTEHKYIHLCIS